MSSSFRSTGKNKTKVSPCKKYDYSIHAGLVVESYNLESLPDDLKTFLEESSFSQGYVALIHYDEYRGGITYANVETKYKEICKKENSEDIIARGYWKKGSALILEITHKSKPLELILTGCGNERPSVIKKHIRDGKYGNPVRFENKIKISYNPYIYKCQTKMTINKW